MKTKPDYEKFGKTIKYWNEHNVAYGINDMVQLAFECHTPIPKNLIIEGRVRRDNLVGKIVNYWRIAENWYLETGKDTLKEKVKKIQDRLHLNDHEVKLLEEQCNQLGI